MLSTQMQIKLQIVFLHMYSSQRHSTGAQNGEIHLIINFIYSVKLFITNCFKLSLNFLKEDKILRGNDKVPDLIGKPKSLY